MHEPALRVRPLKPENGREILSLYRQCGRDGAWCGERELDAVFAAGTWWGGFAEGALCFCAACVPPDTETPQARMLCGALADAPAGSFLLPPAFSADGAANAQKILELLPVMRAEDGTARGDLAAAVPMKYPAELLAGYLKTGLTAFRVRPLVSLRPNYLLAVRPLKPPAPGTPPYFCLPLEGTLPLSRMLEQGYAVTALRRLPPDKRLMAELRATLPPQ